MRSRTTRGLLAFSAAFLLAAAARAQTGQPWLGNPAPSFSLSTLEGKKVSLSDWKGKLVVLHFGTGW